MKHFAPCDSDQKISKVIKDIIRHEKSRMVAYLVVSIGLMFVVGASPYAWGKFVEYISNQNFKNAQIGLGIVLVLTALEIGIKFILESIRYKNCHAVDRMLQDRVSHDIISTPFSKFEKMNTGSIMSKINSDLNVISSFISEDLLKIILCILSIIFYVAIITTQSMLFLLIVLINCSVVFFLNKGFGENNRVYYKIEKESADKYQHQFLEGLRNFIEIKAFGLEAVFKKKFSSALCQCEVSKNGYSKVRNNQETTILLINVLGECIYMILGFVYIKNNWMSLAMFIALFNYSAMLKQNIFEFSRTLSNIRTMSVSFDRIEEVLIEKESYIERFGFNQSVNLIQIQQVDFGYEKHKKIIDNFTHQFEKGKIYVLAGKNGSGKSTLLKLLRGLYDVNNGSILVNETNIQSIHEEDQKNMTTFLCQEGSLFNDTLIRNITRFESPPDMERVNEIVALLNLKTHLKIDEIDHFMINEKGSNVSGGQKQLINIARFMYHNAPIILLDEMTSALDSHKTEMVANRLNAIKKDHIIVIASHEPEIFKIADEICYFDGDGNISICDYDQIINNQYVMGEVGIAEVS